MRALAITALLAAACVPPKASQGSLDVVGSAPTTLDALANYLFKNHGNKDAAVPAEALVNLERWIEQFADDGHGISANTRSDARSWTLKPLGESDVATLPKRPDRPLKNLIASGVAYVSKESITCHAAVQAGTELLPIESTARTYVRTFLEQDDPHCFVTRECDELKTKNDILRASILFEAQIELYKDYRWFDYELDGAPRRAFFSRGWAPETSDSTDGPKGNQLWQNYSIDVWIDRGNDVLRFQTIWSETELYLAGSRVDDGAQLATVASTTDQIFGATDRYIQQTIKPAGRCQ